MLISLAGLVRTSDVDPVRAVSCAPSHCYSHGIENSVANGYAGTKNTHWVLDVNNSGSVAWAPMWLVFPDGHWVEVGTRYENGLERHYSWNCSAVQCDYIWNAVASLGNHVYRIGRNTSDNSDWDIYVDGDFKVTALNNWTYGDWLGAGYDSTNPNLHVDAFATYDLKYKTGNGSFQDWAGKDDFALADPPNCGFWNSATSWWAAENEPCV